MMKIFITLLFALSILACGNKALEAIEAEDSFGDIEKYSRRKSDAVKQGPYAKFTREGIKLEEATYKNGMLHGFRILFSEKGDTQVIEHYRRGLFEGEYKSFYDNGQLEMQGRYENNTMTGKWKRFYDSGEPMEIVAFENNEENGPFVEYYKNGNLKAEGTYLDGDNEHGLLKLYDETGELIRKMNCDRGICRTFWQAGKS